MMSFLGSTLFPDGISELDRFHFEFGIGLPVWAGAMILVLVGGTVAVHAFRSMRRGSNAFRLFLSALRGLAAGLILFLLLDPVLTAFQVRPSEKTVAVVFDNSQSMKIRHGDDANRGELFREAYDADDGRLRKELSKRFEIAYFGFGQHAYRISTPEALSYDGSKSHLRQAIDEIQRDIGAEKLAGIILLSDGVEQMATPSPEEQVSPKVPVIAATLPEVSWREFEVGNFATPQIDFTDAPVILDVPIRGKGLAGREVDVELMETLSGPGNERPKTLQTRTVRFDGPDDHQRARFEFKPESEGDVLYTVRGKLANTPDSASGLESVVMAGGDVVPENNRQSFLLNVHPEKYKIFYFSGRPNWENAFVRRALAEERQLAFTSHIRISEAERRFVFRGRQSSLSNRLFEGFDPDEVEPPRYDEAVFLRFGSDAESMSEGYPTRESDLFDYDLVIWSDIEYGFFNQEQIRQTREFVRKRGGTLLLLGGPAGFSNADFAGTLVEGLLPVLLPQGNRPGAAPSGARPTEEWIVSLTLEGEISGAWSLDSDLGRSQEIWDGLPPLSGVNPFAAIKPGATVAAKAVRDMNSLPLYVSHRYGEGRTAALATGTTWLWKMERPPDDTVHQRVWRQIVRDLVRDAPDRLRLLSRRDVYSPGDTSELRFEIRDRNFDPREGLQIQLEVAGPGEEEAQPLPVDESLKQPGIYEAQWQPRLPGTYAVRLKARTDDGEFIGEFEDHLLVSEDTGEFFNAQSNPALLHELAEASGGRILSLAELSSAARHIPWTPPASLEPLRFHLWHLPPVYAFLAGMLCLEWFLRRRKGLA